MYLTQKPVFLQKPMPLIIRIQYIPTRDILFRHLLPLVNLVLMLSQDIREGRGGW